jgi:hypothetical protein
MVKILHIILFCLFVNSCQTVTVNKFFLGERISDNFDLEFVIKLKDEKNVCFGDTIQISAIIRNKTDSIREINIAAPLFMGHVYDENIFVFVETEKILYMIVPIGSPPNYVSIAGNDSYTSTYSICVNKFFYEGRTNNVCLQMLFGIGNGMMSNNIQLFVEK